MDDSMLDSLVKSRHSRLPVPGRQVKTGIQRILTTWKHKVVKGVRPRYVPDYTVIFSPLEMKLCAKWQQKFGYVVEAPNYKHQITNKFQWSKF